MRSGSPASGSRNRNQGRAFASLAALFIVSASPLATAASSVGLAWNANPETNISGYRVSYGTTVGNYPSTVSVGATPAATVSGLNEGTTYYFVVAAINNAGQQSPNSAVVSYFVPVVAPSNRAPVALANSLSVPEDTQLTVVLSGTDADSNPLTYSVVNAPTKGTLSGTAPNLRYTPTADATGADSFTFRVYDGSLYSAAATVSINITSVNDAPVANSRSVTTNKNTALPIVLSGSDKDSFTLAYSVVASPTNGRLTGTAPNLTYTPNANYVGADQFTFRVNDGALNSPTATISITVAQTATAPTTPTTPTTPVAPTNVAPVFASSPFYTADASEGTAYVGQTLAGRATDAQPITYWKVSGPAWLDIATNGALSGTPPLGSSGLNSFIVRAADSAGLTADATLRINVSWLPVPWQSANVGIGQLPGLVTYGAGTFTQTGSGALGGNRDNFRFTYQMLSGDGEISAKVGSMLSNGTWVRAGVMIRDSMAQNSRQVFMGLTNATSYRWVSRTKAGAKNSTKTSTSSAGADTWVRLVRKGSKIMAYRSTNGINWTFVGTTSVTLNRDCYIGLAVASGANAANFTAQFSNVNVTP
jgi:regulation of enolase protein 1 (concanavalin A-like superfamily)